MDDSLVQIILLALIDTYADDEPEEYYAILEWLDMGKELGTIPEDMYDHIIVSLKDAILNYANRNKGTQ